MKRRQMLKPLVMLAVMMTLCACQPKIEEPPIKVSPAQAAWSRIENDEKAVEEAWGGTEVYAYLDQIAEDIGNLYSHIVFKDDFSLEKESKELDGLKKLYEDMGYSGEKTLEEFRDKLKDSRIRWVSGGKPHFSMITDKGNDVYDVEFQYFANADTLNRMNLTVRKDADGVFHTDFE